MILKHIYLDKFFLFFLLIIILTGNFNYFFAYFSLLLIHELGHAITGIILGYKLEKIVFYPLGGVTIFNLPINISLKHELLIIIMGPIMQIIGFFLLKNFFPFILLYHYVLLFFNLLPIYPLDGGKILNILCNYQFNYLTSFNIVYIVSLIMILLLIIYNFFSFNLNLCFMIILIISKLIRVYHNRFFFYQRFLLERYMYKYHFRKIKCVHNYYSFYRDRWHYINNVSEKDYLKKVFTNHIIKYEKKN